LLGKAAGSHKVVMLTPTFQPQISAPRAFYTMNGLSKKIGKEKPAGPAVRVAGRDHRIGVCCFKPMAKALKLPNGYKWKIAEDCIFSEGKITEENQRAQAKINRGVDYELRDFAILLECWLLFAQNLQCKRDFHQPVSDYGRARDETSAAFGVWLARNQIDETFV
jgi:hypothetical protein